MVKIQVNNGKGETTINTNNVWDRIVALEDNVKLQDGSKISEEFDKVNSSLAQTPSKTIDLSSRGAKGNTVSEDTNILQTIINEIAVAGTGSIYIPDIGKPFIIGAINIPAIQRLYLWGNGKIVLSGVGAGLSINGNLDVLSLKDIEIVGSGVLADNHNGIYVVDGYTIKNVMLDNAKISGCKTNDLGTIENLWIRDNNIRDTVGTNVGEGYGIISGKSKKVVVDGNIFERSTRHSLYLGTTVNAKVKGNIFYQHRLGQGTSGTIPALEITRGAEKITVSGNTFDKCETLALDVSSDNADGVDHITKDIKVTNNLFIDTNGKDIKIGASSATSATLNVENVTVSGNTFKALQGLDNSNSMPILFYAGRNVKIENNEFLAENNFQNARYGIQLNSAGFPQFSENIYIQHNTGIITGANTAFVYVATGFCTGTTKIVIKDNDVACGTLINYQSTPTNPNIITDSKQELAKTLAAGSQTFNIAGYNYFYLTGNAGGSTITDFINNHADKEITLRFKDALTTIVNSADIVLKSGANYVSKANDIIKFKDYAGTWIQV